MRRQITADAVQLAHLQWAKAPVHIRAMACAYVGPLLAALVAINNELQAKA